MPDQPQKTESHTITYRLIAMPELIDPCRATIIAWTKQQAVERWMGLMGARLDDFEIVCVTQTGE